MSVYENFDEHKMLVQDKYLLTEYLLTTEYLKYFMWYGEKFQ